MKRQKQKLIVAETIHKEITPVNPEFLARICSRCLQHPAVGDSNLCRACQKRVK